MGRALLYRLWHALPKDFSSGATHRGVGGVTPRATSCEFRPGTARDSSRPTLSMMIRVNRWAVQPMRWSRQLNFAH